MFTKFLHFIDKISEKIGIIVSVLIYGVMGVLVFEVFARYFLNRPTIWAHEASTFFFGAYFLLGGAFCLKREGMISVDIIYGRLSRKQQAVLNMITFLFFLAVCYVLIWLGGKEAIYSWTVRERSNSTWEPPLYHLKTVIPVAAFFLLLQGIARFIREASILFHGEEPVEK